MARTRAQRMQEQVEAAIGLLTTDPGIHTDAVNLALNYPGLENYQHAVVVAKKRMGVANGRTPELWKRLFPGKEIGR